MERDLDLTLSFPFRLAILSLTVLFWLVLFFIINRRPVEPECRLDLATSLDRRIPFVPVLALVYFSTYPFVLQPFFILTNARWFYWMLACFISITLFSGLIHAVVPSKIERVEEMDAGGITGWGLRLFQKICKPHGNFPSMHVGLSVPVVIVNFMVGGSLVGVLTLVWGISIALSTLFTKQHYILDVLAGVAGGLVIVLLTYQLMMV